MKNRLSLMLVLMTVMLMATTVVEYAQAETAAARWRELDVAFHDKNPADTDGMSDAQVQTLIAHETSGAVLVPFWVPDNGMVSMLVLEKRVQDRSWWSALQLSERLRSQHPGSTVARLADSVSRSLGAAVVSGALALVCLVAAGVLSARPRRA